MAPKLTVKKECKVHGFTDFYAMPYKYTIRKGEKAGLTVVSDRYRCKACNVESVRSHRKRLKLKAVAYLGGACIRCGYDKFAEVLEFHHRDPSQKDFGIAQKGLTFSWARIQMEVDKCDLLCANCHREVHIELGLATP